MEINEIIAVNLKRMREERNLSLGQLAEKAGVSKVMLSQLEKGSSNPTMNTIWKIVGALEIPYNELLDAQEPNIIHVKKADIRPLDENKFHIYNYYRKDANRKFELYEVELEAGGVRESIGHSTDSSEYVVLVEGEMDLEVNGEIHHLEKDDGFCFDATVPHAYSNAGKENAKAVMIVYYHY